MRKLRCVMLAAASLAFVCVSCNEGPPTAPIAQPSDVVAPPPLFGEIAFASSRDGNPEIYTANADGSNLRRLTNDPADDLEPAWSPDGKRIAFVSSRAGEGASDIYVMNADGTNVVRRTIEGDNRNPAWSPDGRRIAFISRRDRGPLVHVMSVDGDWRNPTLVGFPNDIGEARPSWSPDGARITFTSYGDYTSGFFTANLDGSGIIPLYRTNPSSSNFTYLVHESVVWSPDGTRVALVNCHPFPCMETSKLQVMNPDGTGVVTLAVIPSYGNVSWSPDGEVVAYSTPEWADGFRGGAIKYLRVDGSGGGTLVENAYDVAWKPDPGAVSVPPVTRAPSNLVASDPVSLSGNVFLSAASSTFRDGGGLRFRNRTTSQVAAAAIIDGGFDPVGIEAKAGDDIDVVFTSSTGDLPISMVVKVPPRKPPSVVRTKPAKGRTDVALSIVIEVIFTEPIDRQTVNATSLRVLRGGTPIPGTVSVSDDGLTATFTPDNPLDRLTDYTIEIAATIRDLDGDTLEGGETATFTTTDRPPGVIAFVSERDGNPEIYVTDSLGVTITRLTNHPAQEAYPVWSPDGQRIAFLSTRDGGDGWNEWNVYVMNADGSNVRRRTMQPVALGGIAWSTDGRRIAYSQYADDYLPIFVAEADGDWARADQYPSLFSYNLDPSWSPDGSTIVFGSDWGTFDGSQIIAANADGTNRRVLLTQTANFANGYDSGEMYFQPAWSPDGSKIAVVACHFAPHNCYPYSTISVVNADGSGLTTLKFAGGYARPTWSPDGRYIAFSSAACQVCPHSIRYTRADGNNAAIADDLLIADGYSPAWKPR